MYHARFTIPSASQVYMEHSNPLLRGQEGRRFIIFGEVMLRLTPPNRKLFNVMTVSAISKCRFSPK